MEIEEKKDLASNWFRDLRDRFCQEFETIDGKNFERKEWKHSGSGGGEISLMKGNFFEKVGVNISTVSGEFKEDYRSNVSGTEKSPKYWASGLSIVAHMHSPYIPAFHFNTRFIVTGSQWFGGGADMTPTFVYKDDVKDFHIALKGVCDKYDEKYYSEFKKNCSEYFFLPHRNEERGEGGIFFDHLITENWENDFSFVKDVGLSFLEIVPNIIKKRKDKKWDKEDKHKQLLKRGRYVEFNLLWDRGTQFGLKTGGNTEAILMSMPPEARWE
ncbi:MAG: oxygen-dependent coproporphyrinogen oxidase [Pseudomonadota bacterium]|nr:oxygen-dependent coproporphyrinogen oxidase [Pseudomonadota bacterium]